MDISLQIIGTIHSPLKKLDDCPLQESENAPEAELVILPAFEEGIKNIRSGSELVLLTWFHLADRSIIETHPRNDVSLPLTGIFSTRSPDRPNPIGLHTVKVTSISGRSINVSGLEALDQTPVIDIKPVLNGAR